MSEVAPLISDLATILIIAGIITVIFKWLGQPVIVGYIVAGIMAGPSISLFPTVSDQANIKIWADIGVIFLLFAIGLDFSFRKLISVGASAIFSTVIIVCGHDVPGIYGRQCDGLLTHELYLSGRNAVHVLHRHRIQSIQ